MSDTKKKSTCWGFGLSEQEIVTLQSFFGSSVTLAHWPAFALPGARLAKSEAPLLIITSPDGEVALNGLSKKHQKEFADTPKVFLLPEEYSADDMELAITSKAMQIVKHPLTKKEIWSAILEAHEAISIRHDIKCMTRELLLERELLERKNELLSFLVSFFSNIAKDFSTEGILSRAFESFATFLPVRSIHAAIWYDTPPCSKEIDIFLNTDPGSHEESVWKDVLKSEVEKHLGPKVAFSARNQHRLSLTETETLLPDAGNYFPLYFSDKQNLAGIILLVNEAQRPLGRDQTKSLALALNHLALVLSSSRLYMQAREEADIDVLTGLYNRRHFENTLSQEMQRVTRYGQPLALMMLDIDHFKRVNDTYGHNVGDLVLKDVAAIIRRELRTTDYSARFGGEEFCALLPATDQEQAYMVAERLRNAVAAHPFLVKDTVVHVTISIGMSYLTQHDNKTPLDFLHEADSHLYAAKECGRNRTEDCICALPALAAVGG